MVLGDWRTISRDIYNEKPQLAQVHLSSSHPHRMFLFLTKGSMWSGNDLAETIFNQTNRKNKLTNKNQTKNTGFKHHSIRKSHIIFMTQKRSHTNKTNSVFLSGDTATPFQGWEEVSRFPVFSWYFNNLSRIWSSWIDVKYQLRSKWSVLVWSSAVKGMWQPLATLSTSEMYLPMKNCQINWLDCVNEAKWSTGSFTCELK